MKPGAVLIQGSRGGIVDEAALASSLISGHLGGAAVDVYSTEPPAPDNPLLKLAGEAASRLLLTPHHRRCLTPGLDDAVSRGLAECRAGAGAEAAAAQPGVLSYFFSSPAALATGAQRSTSSCSCLANS